LRLPVALAVVAQVLFQVWKWEMASNNLTKNLKKGCNANAKF